MKNFLTTIFCFAFLFSFSQQCTIKKVKELENTCVSKLKTFEYLSSFPMTPTQFTYGGEKIEFKKNFYKGTTYVFVLNDLSQSTNKLVVEIFDNHHRLVATNHIKNSSKFYAKIFFPCKSTGVYYVRYSYNDDKPSCGFSVMGFSTSFKPKH